MLNLWIEKLLVWRYGRLSLIFGDMLSYSYMGIPVGFERIERRIRSLEKKLQDLGYETYSDEEKILAGGYGESPRLIKKPLSRTDKS